MNIDKIEYVGLINNTPNDKHNIFIFDNSMFEIYNYSYLQQQMATNHSRNTWFQEHRFIIENDNSIILSQLQKFQKHANKISEEMRSPDIIENINIS